MKLGFVHTARWSVALLALGVSPQLRASPQALVPGVAVPFSLPAGQSTVFALQGQAGGMALLTFQLDGGLIAVASSTLPAWRLDLGRGGRLDYALPLEADGTAILTVRSSERIRAAGGNLTLQPETHSSGAAALYAVEQALLAAEGARTHQPDAVSPSVALRDYDRAVALCRGLHDTPMLRLALTQKARYLLFARSDFPAARALLMEALDLPDAQDAARQALAAKTLSSAEMFLGNYDQAIAAGERALALYRQTGDRYWQGVVLGNLVSAYDAVGQTGNADAAGREAVADAEATQDPAGVVFSLSQVADVDRERGNLQSAFREFRDAVLWAQGISYAPLVRSELEEETGAFYADLGMAEDAEDQLRSALDDAGGAENTTTLEARGLLARLLAQHGRMTGALHQYDTAIALVGRLHAPQEEASLLLGRAKVLMALGRQTAAAHDVDRADTIAHALEAPALLVRVALARGMVATSPAAALTAWRAALAAAGAAEEPEEQASALAGCAQAQIQLGEPAAALESIGRALALVEHEHASLLSRDLAGSYMAEHRAWYALAVTAAMQQAARAPGSGYEAAAFVWAERARARTLLDSLAQRAWGPAPETSAALERRIALNRHAILDAENLLGTPHADTARAAKTLRALYRDQDALDAEQRGAAGPSLLAAPIAGVAAVQRMLPDSHTAMIALFSTRRHTYRWVITRSRLRVSELPGAVALKQRFAPLLDTLALRNPAVKPGESAPHYGQRAALARSGRDAGLLDAGSLLLSGLPPGIHTLYIVADGPLLSLPLAALRLPCGRGACYAVERYTLVSEPSASAALSLSTESAAPEAQRIAVIADGGARSPNRPTLTGASTEARAIVRLAGQSGVPVQFQPDATAAGVRSLDGRQFRAFHIAAHTVLVADHPELSGIALGPTAADEDGILWLRDISSMHAPPLVVLSGCETQGGRYLAGESLNSLAQAFFFAGARRVVASLWSVDDDTAAGIMQRFYQELLHRHRTAPEALRAAQLDALRRGIDLSDWAAFAIDGAASGTVSPDSRNNVMASRE